MCFLLNLYVFLNQNVYLFFIQKFLKQHNTFKNLVLTNFKNHIKLLNKVLNKINFLHVDFILINDVIKFIIIDHILT